MSFSSSFPNDRLRQNANAFRTWDFHARAQMLVRKVIPEVVSALSSAAPLGHHYIWPSTEPVEGGALKRSFYGITEWQGPATVNVAFKSTAKYAGYVLGGTKPHQISAKNTDYLAYWMKGKGWSFSKTVNHPGTRPYDYAIVARALIQSTVPEEWSLSMKQFPNL